MIVELIGLPGCGKTTLQTGILSNDAYKKYKFVTRDEIVKNSIIFNRKFTLKLMLLDPRMWVIIRDVYLLKRELPISDKRQLWINRFLVMTWAIMRNKKKNLLLDEGVIQYVSSILHEENAQDYKRVQALMEYLGKRFAMGYIFLNTDEKICLQRIRERNRTNDRYNLIDNDEDLLHLLGQKKKNVLAIANMTNVKFNLMSDGNIDSLKLERFLL